MTTPEQHHDGDGARGHEGGQRIEPQYAEAQPADPRYAEGPHTDPQHPDAQHPDTARGDGQYTDAQYTDAQYAGGQHTDPGLAEDPRAGTRHGDPQPAAGYDQSGHPDQAASVTASRTADIGGDGTPDARDGHATGTDTARTAGTHTGGHTGNAVQADSEERERLVPADRADSYGSRWDAVKGTFVDEPRQAVAQADELVGELLAELEGLFREQRRSIEHGLDNDETSTEELRVALRRYRSFFDRLLSL
jgi:hypothetical protein